MTAQVAQAEQTLNATEAVAQKKAKELKSLQSQTKEQRTIALTVEEIQSMGKKNPITGNISLTPQECDTLKSYAVNSIIAKADNGRLQERLASAQKSAAIWKKRYESLSENYQELKKERPALSGRREARTGEGAGFSCGRFDPHLASKTA